MFAERGFARARLEDVGRRAGVSKGTVYLYFDSKEALLQELVRSRVGTAVAAGEQFVSQYQGPTRDLLVTFIHRFWEVVRQPDNARLARLVFSELGNFPELARFYMQDVVRRVRAVIAVIIERGVARGEFRPVSPPFAARALQLLCAHLAQHQQFFRPTDDTALTDEDVVTGIVDLYLHGVLAGGGGEARRRSPGGHQRRPT